jgi:amino acid transporter
MLRKLTSITLLVSVVAVGISGLLMIILGSFKFQLQMHPVHKVFGILMCVSAVFHIYENFKPIKSYLKVNKIAISAAVLTTLLICLAVIGMNKPLNNTIIEEIESKMVQLEQKN